MRNINIYSSDLFPYLEGEELLDLTLTLTVKDIRPEKLKNQQGREETKEVLFFQETPKGLILNKTNAKRLAKMFGKMTGEWAGHQVTLYTEKVQAFGESHNAIRVKMQKPPLTNGNMSLEKLLINLKKVERIRGFFSGADDILVSLKRPGPPAPGDTEGWRQLFVAARDHAFEEMEQPDQPPLTGADDVPRAEDDGQDPDPDPDEEIPF